LHQGSLVAAVASYLEARTQQGQWLLRMEDVDELRNVKGAADSILRSLEAYGFEWDESVIYQTQRKDAYEAALQQLKRQALVYPCTCSRKQLRAAALQGKLKSGPLGYIYPGTCRSQVFRPGHPHDYAIRIKTPHREICIEDALQGHYCQHLGNELGDFVIRRRDGLFAYQLAVVVDDAWQNISHVVRGADLLDSTPRQVFLQQCLGYAPLHYAHLPIMCNAQGDKLSKQTGAEGIGHSASVPRLVEALRFLGQQPPAELQRATLKDIWQWALANWQLQRACEPDQEQS
jgi:glutamyl-Q tRNA(Asp) synthetase